MSTAHLAGEIVGIPPDASSNARSITSQSATFCFADGVRGSGSGGDIGSGSGGVIDGRGSAAIM